MTKIIVEHDLTPADIAKHLFKKCRIATVANYAGNSNWIIPSFGKSMLDINMDEPLVTITDNGSQFNIENANYSGRTPSNFEFYLDKLLTWIQEGVENSYRKLTIGQLYSLYLLYQISRLIFDLEDHADLLELASNISYNYDKNYENIDNITKLADELAPKLAVLRKPLVGQENHFINYFRRILPKEILTPSKEEYYDKTKAVNILQFMIQADIVVDQSEKLTGIDMKTDFNTFEKHCIVNILKSFLKSHYFSLQMMY